MSTRPEGQRIVTVAGSSPGGSVNDIRGSSPRKGGHGRMDSKMAKQLLELQKEHPLLKKVVANLTTPRFLYQCS